MEFDPKLNKYDKLFIKYSDEISNLSQNRYNVLFNNNQFRCGCNLSFKIEDIDKHKDEKYHKWFVKEELQRLKLLQYEYYIKRNRIIDKYFLI